MNLELCVYIAKTLLVNSEMIFIRVMPSVSQCHIIGSSILVSTFQKVVSQKFWQSSLFYSLWEVCTVIRRLDLFWKQLFSDFAVTLAVLFVECTVPCFERASSKFQGREEGKGTEYIAFTICLHGLVRGGGSNHYCYSQVRNSWWQRRLMKLMYFLRKCYWYVLTTDTPPAWRGVHYVG